jgi:aspartyl-tRNA(Asn)/glutamyl-tRNA(Gln) amidotransferase subunit B
MVSEGTLNASSAKLVLREIFQSGQSPQAIVEQRNLAQISDEGYLTGIIAQVLDENPDAVASYLAGKETVLQWLMGQIARQTRGKANPQIARHLLLEMLKKRQGERKKD